MQQQYVLGIDNGGTVIKAAIYDLSGNEIMVASCRTPVESPRPGYNERNMEQLWRMNCQCIREVLEKSAVDPHSLNALAVCGHGKGLYLWGCDDKPACNGISSTDNRAWMITQKWYENGIADILYPKLCQKLIPCQQAPLLYWMKENNRPVYDNIKWVFSVKDYIRFRLTGEAYSEASDISGSGLLNVQEARFDQEILDTLGIGEMTNHLAPLCHSDMPCGHVTHEAAQLTGLIEGTPVAGGMFDIDACALALAVTEPEQLCTITGTWSINEFISKVPITGTAIAMNSLYAMPGYYLIEESSATSAGNLDWVLRNIAGKPDKFTADSIYAEAERMADSVRPDECDVYWLPFLYGTNAHPLAKGSLVGLTNYHNTAHVLRAVYEGVAFSHKMHIEHLLSTCKPPKAIRMGGGAVQSDFWVQMFADVLGYPIETVKGVTELGTLGCAMAASVAAGIYHDYKKATENMVRIDPPVNPDQEKQGLYARKYNKYLAVVKALDTVWNQFTV
jgi:L-xylulokinase